MRAGRAWANKDLSRLEKAVINASADPEAAVAAAIEVLSAPEPRSRRALLLRLRAAMALCTMGEKASAAAPYLKGMLSSKCEHQRALAAHCLSEIGAYKEALPELAALMKGDGSYGARASAARAIGRLGRIAAESIPDLAMALDSEIFRTVRMEIVMALGRTGSRNALPALRKASRDPYASVRGEAKAAIRGILNRKKVHG